jgi:hypothetical protein
MICEAQEQYYWLRNYKAYPLHPSAFPYVTDEKNLPQCVLLARVLNDFNTTICCSAMLHYLLFNPDAELFVNNKEKRRTINVQVGWVIVCLQSALDPTRGLFVWCLFIL